MPSKPRPPKPGSPVAPALAQLVDRVVADVDALRFSAPVTHVYNPLAYARPLVDAYLAHARVGVPSLLLGMNPGPWGMVQTGVPFGEVAAVRDFLGLRGEVGQPARLHPKRPVEGLACRRSEVSGKRLWTLAKDELGSPEAFFERFFVWNYCPLAFFAESGENLTPDKLRVAERAPLEAACDRALVELVELLRPARVIGVGAFAEARASEALKSRVAVGRIPHPSPASPLANRGWAAAARLALREQGALA